MDGPRIKANIYRFKKQCQNQRSHFQVMLPMVTLVTHCAIGHITHAFWGMTQPMTQAAGQVNAGIPYCLAASCLWWDHNPSWTGNGGKRFGNHCSKVFSVKGALLQQEFGQILPYPLENKKWHTLPSLECTGPFLGRKATVFQHFPFHFYQKMFSVPVEPLHVPPPVFQKM